MHQNRFRKHTFRPVSGLLLSRIIGIALGLFWVVLWARLSDIVSWSLWLLLAPIYVPVVLLAIERLFQILVWSYTLWEWDRAQRRRSDQARSALLNSAEIGFIERYGLRGEPQFRDRAPQPNRRGY